jgi:hypothetical protein
VQPTQQKPRTLRIKVDRFIVTILIYHNGRAVATIGTREQPIPISDVPGHVSTSLTALAGEIRSTLCNILAHSGGNRIVPPVHEWRLMHIDLNTDVRVSANTYADLAINSAQLELADKVFLGVYRTMTDKLDRDHHRYARVEDRNHQFKAEGRNGTPLDDTVGQVVTSAVENFRRQIEESTAA